jgi:hypothetical protein
MVDFPDPEAPTIPMEVPLFKVRETESRTVSSTRTGYAKHTPLKTISFPGRNVVLSAWIPAVEYTSIAISG